MGRDGAARLVAILTLAAAVAACGGDGSSSVEVITVPENHVAVGLSASSSFEELSAAAQEQGVDFYCGSFAVAGPDHPPTSACLVDDGGVLAVIALDYDSGWEYVISGPAIDSEVTVPVDEADVYGVEVPSGQVTLSVMMGDRLVGTVTRGS